MPRVTIQFELPEEQSEFNMSMNAGDLYSAVHEIDMMIRAITKYGTDESLPSEVEELSKDQVHGAFAMAHHIRKKMWEILNDHDINELY